MAGKQVLRIETRDRLRLGNARHVAALVRGARPAVRVRRLGSADGLGALPRLGGEGAGGRGRRCGWGNRDGPGTAGAPRGHGPLTVRGPGARTRRGVPESVGRDAQGEPPSRGARGRRGLCLVSTTLAEVEADPVNARRRWRADPAPAAVALAQSRQERRAGVGRQGSSGSPFPLLDPGQAPSRAFCGRERHRQPLVSRGPAPVEPKGGGRRIGGLPGAGRGSCGGGSGRPVRSSRTREGR